MWSDVGKLVESVISGNADAVEEAERCVRNTSLPQYEESLRRALVSYYTKAAGMRRTDFGANHLTRNYDAALGHMRILTRGNPENTQDALQFYWLLNNTGRLAEALSGLESEAEKLSGKPPEFGLNVVAALARVNYKLGAFERAETLYRQLIERAIQIFGHRFNPSQGRFVGAALARMARIQINTGRPVQAAELIDNFPYSVELDVLERTRRRAEVLINKGFLSAEPEARPVDTNALTIVCVKHGSKYGPEYVNRLHQMLRRNLHGSWQFVCFTDDPEGLDPEVDVIDISHIKVTGWWTKIAMFDPRLSLRHDTVLYLDLDTVVVSSLNFLNGLKVGFHIFEHPDAPCFNSSVMLFNRQIAARIFERITKRDVDRLPGDQEWVEDCMPNADTFEHGAINLYRALEPDVSTAEIVSSSAQIVTFPANPKPHQITSGWVKDLWV